MKKFMIRNKRHRYGSFEQKLEIGKTYWMGWRGCSYSQTFVFCSGKTIVLLDSDGNKDVCTKRWLKKITSNEAEFLHFLVEIEPD